MRIQEGLSMARCGHLCQTRKGKHMCGTCGGGCDCGLCQIRVAAVEPVTKTKKK